MIENPSFLKLILDKELIDISLKQIISKIKNMGKYKSYCANLVWKIKQDTISVPQTICFLRK